MTGEGKEGLRRDISIWDSTVLAVNGMIGAGIFVLPAISASMAGFMSPALYLVCGMIMMLIVVILAQLTKLFDRTGGPVLYVTEAFHPSLGFLTGWILYIGTAAGIAANMNILVSYSGQVIATTAEGVGRVLMITFVMGSLVFVNVAGVKNGIRATWFFTIAKIAPLALITGIGLSRFRLEPFKLAELPTNFSPWAAIFAVIYAFIGCEWAVVPAGEAKDPQRQLAISLLWTVIGISLFYALIQTACLLILPGLAQSKAPLTDAAREALGETGAMAFALVVACSVAGNLSTVVLALPRLTYSMARNGCLPDWFARIHGKYGTPANSILTLGVLVVGLAATGTFMTLAKIAVLAKFIGYGLSILAYYRLKTGSERRGSLSLTDRVIIVLALGVCVTLISQANLLAWITLSAVILIGLCVLTLTKGKIGLSTLPETPPADEIPA